MSPELYQRAKAMLPEALELSPPRRTAFLNSACGGDAELRRQVESLLRFSEGDSDAFSNEALANRHAILAKALGSSAHTLPLGGRSKASAAQPDRIGGYRILSTLGEGGMGVVYEAEQEHPHRTVALKVLRPGIYSPRLVQRFEHEAELLGQLQHPGIAHIYDAGAVDLDGPGGASVHQPYFAMELVRGVPLTEFARARLLGLRERLALFSGVCDAVHHAHQSGVVHRDLKPANILVDQSGRPRILDFGVARVLGPVLGDAAQETQTLPGQLIGTLPYMSPEQVDGRREHLDTRSDVYALGVVLYELLTGRLPYDLNGKPIAAAARIICETSPTPLGAANRAYAGDLDTIVLRALEKDPDRRYASVHALSEDIRRFLHNEPIAARPPSALYQMRKFAQRNRALVGGLIATFASLLIGLPLATYGLWTASEERDQKAKALSAEIVARGEAEAISNFLSDMLASADPGRQGQDARVIDLLDAAAGTANERFADRPLVQARLRHVIGVTYQRLGAYDRAEPHLRFSLDTRTALLGEQHADTIDSTHELGALYNEWGRFADAEPLDVRALQLNRLIRGNEHERTLSSIHELGLLYSRQGRHQDSLPLQEEAHRLCRRLLGERHPTTLSAASNLGLLYKRLARYDDALVMYEATLADRREVLGPEHLNTLVSMNNLAHLYRSLGRLQDAADLHAETLAIRRRVLTDAHPHTVMSMDNLAMLLTDLERYDEAEKLLVEALEHKRRIFGDEGPETLVSMNNLATNYARLGRMEEARTLYEQTLAIRRRVLGNEHQETTHTIENLADTLFELNRNDEARALCEESLASRLGTLAADHPLVAESQYRLGRLALADGDALAAAEHFRASLAINEAKLPDRHWRTGQSRVDLARALALAGNYTESERLLLSALECFDDAATTSHRARAIAHLVGLYEAWDEAEPGNGLDQKAAAWRAKR